MGLYQTIADDMKNALKKGDAVRLSVLRMVISSVKMLEIEKTLKTVEDGDVVSIIQRYIKQHRESIEQFEKGNRRDLADKERGELTILESYMPQQLNQDEVMNLVTAAISETGAKAKSDMGKVMKLVMEKAKGKADGKVISQLVSQILK